MIYDYEHEEHITRAMTVADFLDEFTDEGCSQTIETDRRQGKWISGYSTNGIYYKRCDHCFAEIEDSFFGESSFEVNFCPNCGAYMGGVCDE